MNENGRGSFEQTPISTLPILDRAELLHRCRGRVELARSLAAMFRETAPPVLAALRIAVCDRDAAAIGAKAHALKGNAASLSLKVLAAEVGALDLLARRGSLDQVETLTVRVEKAFRDGMDELLAFERECSVRVG